VISAVANLLTAVFHVDLSILMLLMLLQFSVIAFSVFCPFDDPVMLTWDVTSPRAGSGAVSK